MLKTQSNTNTNTMNSKPELTATRMSARILFRKRLKGLSKRKAQRALVKANDDFPALAVESIQIGNAFHKISFLRLLGLSPIADSRARHDINPHRLSHNLTEKYFRSEDDSSDIDDLDLEVVFCPLDIPDIYEEITKKRHPSRLPIYPYSFTNYINNNLKSELFNSSESRINKRFSSLTNLDKNHHHNQKSPQHSSTKSKLKPVHFNTFRRSPMQRAQLKTSNSNNNNKSLSKSLKCVKSIAIKRLNPPPPMRQSKPKLIQFDDDLDGLRVFSNNNSSNCKYNWGSVEDENSLEQLKMKLGMLDTDLEFV